MEGAGHEEDSGSDDVEVVELYAGHHRHHQEADQLQQGKKGGEACELSSVHDDDYDHDYDHDDNVK